MSASINHVAVCGAGAMGAGIAQVAAQAGAQVVVFDTGEAALDAGKGRIDASLAALVKRGKLTVEDGAAIAERIAWSTDLRTVSGAGLVIEAIIERADVKADLFKKLEAVLAPDAILASNTSSLPISRLASTLQRPERFVGMHFFNPAPVMKLVEVVAGIASAPDVVKVVSATAAAWGKIAVPVADVPGFIVNRVARPYYAEAFTALGEQAAPPQLIDALFRGAAGFKMGPLELTDLIGQDVNFAVARSVFDAYFGHTRFVPQPAQGALVDAGRLGQKTAYGVYHHGEGADARILPRPFAGAAISHPIPMHGLVEIENVLIGTSRGRLAASEARDAGRPVALFDWTEKSGIRAFAASSDEAARVAAGLAASEGSIAYRIADRPGLIVLRTLAQIANGAADAVLEHVADEAGIDTALRYGANYPVGPFEWADRFGREQLFDVLSAIGNETGHGIYWPSEYWGKRR